jgi:hypothetical protein
MSDTRNRNVRDQAAEKAPAATHAQPDVETSAAVEPVEKKGSEVGGTCNLPGCPYDAEVRGLCDAHWGTHRGLANPAEDEPKSEVGPEVALP